MPVTLDDPYHVENALVAGFREVDLIGSVPYGGNEPYTETMTLTPIGDCREKLEAWVGKRSRHV
jgi:hypothetical protein